MTVASYIIWLLYSLYIPSAAQQISDTALDESANLSDLTDKAAARTALELGSAAVLTAGAAGGNVLLLSGVGVAGDITGVNDVTIAGDLELTTGDIVLANGKTVDGRDLSADAAVWGAKQDGDSTLTGLANLVWGAGVQVITLTAADTFGLLTTGSAAGNLLVLDGAGEVPDADIPAGITRDAEAAVAYQPLAAMLTSWSAVAWAAGVQVPTLTAANTFNLLTVGTAASNLVQLDAQADLCVGGACDASAALDITSTTKGLGIPAMTEAQCDAIGTPRDGLMCYATDTDVLRLRANGAWGDVGGGGATYAADWTASDYPLTDLANSQVGGVMSLDGWADASTLGGDAALTSLALTSGNKSIKAVYTPASSTDAAGFLRDIPAGNFWVAMRFSARTDVSAQTSSDLVVHAVYIDDSAGDGVNLDADKWHGGGRVQTAMWASTGTTVKTDRGLTAADYWDTSISWNTGPQTHSQTVFDVLITREAGSVAVYTATAGAPGWVCISQPNALTANAGKVGIRIRGSTGQTYTVHLWAFARFTASPL